MVWNVPGGGVGYSVFHCESIATQSQANGFVAAVRAAFMAANFIAKIPNEVSFAGENEVRGLGLDGSLTSVFPVGGGSSIVGTSAAQWAAAAGGRVNWETGTVLLGRRLRGRTYIVPMDINAYDTNGTLSASGIQALNDFAVAYKTNMAAAGLVPTVWSPTHAFQAPIVDHNVPDKTAILRGRRE